MSVGFCITLTGSFEKLSGRTKQENVPKQVFGYFKEEVIKKKERWSWHQKRQRLMKRRRKLRNKPKERWEFVYYTDTIYYKSVGKEHIFLVAGARKTGSPNEEMFLPNNIQ